MLARGMIVHRRCDDDFIDAGPRLKGLEARRDVIGRADRRTLQHMVEDRPRIGRQAVLITGKRRLHLARIAGAERDEGLKLRRGEQSSEEQTSELQSLMRISYADFCLTKKNENMV